jgi:protein-tyrosine phosphatase
MKILMVCLGNICRSPMAESVLKHKLKEKKLGKLIEVDSAGTTSIHQGEHPDKRAIQTARKHGVDISNLIARPFQIKDFDTFDKIIVMDSSNYDDVISLARNEQDIIKVKMLMNYSKPGSNQALPDPYFGSLDGFDKVYKMIDEACNAIILSLEKEFVS